MHDGIEIERRGIPAAVVCTDQFVVMGNATAEVRGIPGYRYAVVPHPTGRLPEAELLDRVRMALPEVVSILLGE